MASWTKKPCMDILKKLNEVPDEEGKESRQLTILMAGIADITREMMRRSAVKARAHIAGNAVDKSQLAGSSDIIGGTDSKKPAEAEKVAETSSAMDDAPDLDDFDSFDEELDMIEQTLIRSIGD